MNRRLLITALACWPAAPLLAQQEDQRPHHKISAAELHKALSARFPLRFSAAGLLDLQLDAPALLLVPARNQLGATLLVQASGPALRQPQAGEMDVVFGLRYEPADQTVRAERMDVLDLRFPGLRAEAVQNLRQLLPALARAAVGEIVLRQLTPRELALPDTMGFEPDKVTVVEDGVVVSFRTKARP